VAFPQDKVSELLAQCHRRCCICHRFCGVKMEPDHIVRQADSGNDDIDHAIPVSLRVAGAGQIASFGRVFKGQPKQRK
jgi:hypothetical protein